MFGSVYTASRRLRLSSLTCVFVGATIVLPSLAWAQAATGALLGNVRDETGAAVPGATITITEVRTNIDRATTSNETGYYTFTNLPPGVYAVKAEMAGFTTMM
jgi:hypothetical protein